MHGGEWLAARNWCGWARVAGFQGSAAEETHDESRSTLAQTRAGGFDRGRGNYHDESVVLMEFDQPSGVVVRTQDSVVTGDQGKKNNPHKSPRQERRTHPNMQAGAMGIMNSGPSHHIVTCIDHRPLTTSPLHAMATTKRTSSPSLPRRYPVALFIGPSVHRPVAMSRLQCSPAPHPD